MISCSKAIDIGERIHKRVMAEGGYMVHVGDRSWFEKFDRKSGEFSRKFSDDLVKIIVQHRESLKIYAAWRRECMAKASPGDRFFPGCQTGKTGSPANDMDATATQNAGRVMHVAGIDGPVVAAVDLASQAGRVDVVTVEKQAGGGFCARIAPHGARGDGRKEGE